MVVHPVTPSWQDEANALPTWVGAKMIHPDGRTGTVVAVTAWWSDVREDGRRYLMADGHGTKGEQLFLMVEGSVADVGGFVLDLSDPDTRAAFDRRLALKLGATQEQVNEGVMFVDDGRWFVVAGWPVRVGASVRYPFIRALTEIVDVRDPLMARALAWPKS